MTRILIVEDDPFVARDICQQLVELGYEPVAETPRAEEGISLAEQLRPDLVLMEIQLEEQMDGTAAAKVIHDRFGLPVVLMTAFDSEEALDRAMKSDASGYIIKPFDERELRAAIEMALHKHRSEILLRQGHEEQAAILRTALDGFWLIDTKGHILDVNEAGCRMLGYTREEMLGKPLADYEADETASEVAANIEQIRLAGSTTLEHRHRCKDGHLIDVQVSVTYLPGPTGRFSAFIHDITARKRKDDELRQALGSLHRSETKFRTLYDSDPDGVMLFDEHGYFDCNQAALDTFGCTSRDEFFSKHPVDLSPEFQPCGKDSKTLANQRIAAAMESGNQRFEWLHKRADTGATFPTEVLLNAMELDGKRILQAVVRDITERKQAEESNRAHIHFLESLRQIDKAISQETDIEQMLKNVMEKVFIIFNCDRTWLFYPCDPDAPTFRIPIEISKPEYPGANTLNLEVPMDPSVAKDLREALASGEPLSYTLGTDNPVNTLTAQQFAVQSQMLMAIHPKIGKPWVFGMHQCSHPRIWTIDEKVLFKEIGRRVADGLSNTLIFRDLRESEARFRTLVNQAADALFLHDMEGHLLDVNQRACTCLGYTREELLGMAVADVDVDFISRIDVSTFLSQLSHDHPVTVESKHKRKDGTTFPVEIRLGLLLIEGKELILSLARDITERKQAQDEARILTQRLTLATDAASIGIWDWDLKTDQWFATPNYYTMLGYEPEEGFSHRERWIKCIHPEDRDTVSEKIRAVLAGSHEPYQYKARMRHADGAYRWINVIGRVAELDEHGKATRMLGVRLDISEQKRAEAALSENEDRYRDLIDNSQEVIATYDLEGNFLSVNETAIRITGYPREAVLKMNLADLIVPGMRHLFPEYLRTIQALGKANGIMQIQIANGERRFWEYDSTLRTEGVAEPVVRGMALDITERRQAEKALRASESQLKVILESTDDGILAADHQGKILKTNSRFAELWKIPQSIIASGERQALLDYVLPQVSDPEAFLKKAHSLQESDATDLDVIHFKDGRCFERLSAPILDGQIINGRVSSFRDITNRKRAEEAMRENEDRYRDLVDNSLELITTNDFEGNILSANETAIRITGYPREALLKMNMADLIVPKMRHMFPEYLKTLVEVGKAQGIMQIQTAKGDIRFWEYNCTVRTEGVAIPIVRGMALDITERRQAEEALKESHERFELANQATFNVIWDWDLRTNTIWRNDNFEKLFGYSRDEVGTDFEFADNLIHPDDMESVRAGIHVALDNAKSKFWVDQYRFRRKNGQYAVVEDRGIITRDTEGHAIRMLGAMQDITERKQAEEALRESEQVYRSLFENMLNGFAYCQMIYEDNHPNDFIYLSVNNAFGSLTGLKEVVGKKVSEVIPGIQKSDPELLEIYNRVASGGIPEKFENYVEALKMWFSISVYSPGKGYFVAVFDVITERKQAEQALRESEEKLRVIIEHSAQLFFPTRPTTCSPMSARRWMPSSKRNPTTPPGPGQNS